MNCILQLRGVSYIVPKRHELWSTNGFKLDLHFYQPYVNSDSTLLPDFADGHQQMGLNKTFAKRWTVNSTNNLQYENQGRPSRKNWGQKT